MSISKMLGGYKTRLPVYAATVDGSEKGFMSKIDEFADWADQVRELGVKGFKTHPEVPCYKPLAKSTSARGCGEAVTLDS